MEVQAEAVGSVKQEARVLLCVFREVTSWLRVVLAL